jgi:hypothetical protein
MLLGKDTTVALFLNNASDGTATLTEVFVIDGAAFLGYIAAERTTDATTFGTYWNGYIYDFHVY